MWAGHAENLRPEFATSGLPTIRESGGDKGVSEDLFLIQRKLDQKFWLVISIGTYSSLERSTALAVI